MRTKWIAAAAVVMMAFLAYLAWKNNMQRAEPPAAAAPAMPEPGAAPGGGGDAGAQAALDPGLAWQAPAGWTDEGAREMRIASYSVPGKNGGAAECAVYYFGPGQGGTPDANIQRWMGEFEKPEEPQRSTSTVHGFRVTRARIRGAYRSHGGGMGAGMGGNPQGAAEAPQADQELMGAIVEGPQGLVFFKLTGPQATIDGAAGDFDRMIGSLHTK
jgi:hypothetical protein